MLQNGEFYFDVATGRKTQAIQRGDIPSKVVVFSCGGGSFVEYESFKGLNDELFSTKNGSSGGA